MVRAALPTTEAVLEVLAKNSAIAILWRLCHRRALPFHRIKVA